MSPVHRGNPVSTVIPELKAKWDHQVPLELQASQDPRDPQDSLARPGLRDQRENRAATVYQDQLENQDRGAPRVCLGTEVCQDLQDHQETGVQ